jgi:EAL domain-containing protein (putative c-di-GMP-specific phosphodiesterase class I)
VAPGEFIPLAEETGQIIPMTQWMLNRACADAVKLQRELPHGAGLRVSVNVSSRYLNHGHVAEEVREALETHGLAADCLILEVTESLLLENSARLDRIFHELKMIGVRLALDDFGTGYSSLAYLHRFPIDILKIDRSFVERLRRTAAPRVWTRSRSRRRSCRWPTRSDSTRIAEGIEHEEQRDTLLALGCKTGRAMRSAGHARRRDTRGGRHAPSQPAGRQPAGPGRVLRDGALPSMSDS